MTAYIQGGGSASFDGNMRNEKIYNLKDGVNDFDAVNMRQLCAVNGGHAPEVD